MAYRSHTEVSLGYLNMDYRLNERFETHTSSCVDIYTLYYPSLIVTSWKGRLSYVVVITTQLLFRLCSSPLLPPFSSRIYDHADWYSYRLATALPIFSARKVFPIPLQCFRLLIG